MSVLRLKGIGSKECMEERLNARMQSSEGQEKGDRSP